MRKAAAATAFALADEHMNVSDPAFRLWDAALYDSYAAIFGEASSGPRAGMLSKHALNLTRVARI